MSELTKALGGGVSFSNGTGTHGACPRVPTSGAADLEDSPYRSLEVVIPAASVLTLRATPYPIIPAPGAGKVIHFIAAFLELIFVSVAYTESSANLGFKFTDGSGVQVNETVECTGFIDQTASTYTNARQKLDAIVAKSACDNKAIVLHNLGGGEFANSGDGLLKVKVIYAVHASG